MAAACAVLGHRFRFAASGATMTWGCTRCPAGGSKTYPSAEAATRYAAAFDQPDQPGRAPRGRMVPLGLLPLEIARWWRSRRAREVT